MDDWYTIIKEFGFPVFMSFVLLWVIHRNLKENTEVIGALKDSINVLTNWIIKTHPHGVL